MHYLQYIYIYTTHWKFCDDISKCGRTYRSKYQEAGEEVEEWVEEGAGNGRELGVGGDGHHHHTVVRERDQAKEQHIQEPEEFDSGPLKPNHGVDD